MQFRSSLIGCCGVTGIHSLPSTRTHFLNNIFANVNTLRGSSVIIFSSSAQTSANSYLKDLGFKCVDTSHNNKSGNKVHTWIMKRVTFNKKLIEWRELIQ